MYPIYRWAVERATPEMSSAQIDWVGMVGASLSLLILLEGTQVIARTAVHRGQFRGTPGVAYLLLCACYMYSYAVIGGISSGLAMVQQVYRPWALH
jgi:hypothetical protein